MSKTSHRTGDICAALACDVVGVFAAGLWKVDNVQDGFNVSTDEHDGGYLE